VSHFPRPPSLLSEEIVDMTEQLRQNLRKATTPSALVLIAV